MIEKDKITEVRLYKPDFLPYISSHDYRVEYVSVENYQSYTDDFSKIIELMNSELDWDGIPTMNRVVERLKSNSNCLVCKYNDETIGWVWSNPNITLNWIDVYQTLPKNYIYGGGAFLTKTIIRPPDAGLAFYSLFFDFWLNTLNRDYIVQYADDWNRASSILSFKCGFKRYKFLH